MASNFTILEILEELSALTKVDPKIIDRAKKSNITEKNHKGFKGAVKAWADGRYDNDPEVLVGNLDHFIQQRL
jgi:hypothetical protein